MVPEPEKWKPVHVTIDVQAYGELRSFVGRLIAVNGGDPADPPSAVVVGVDLLREGVVCAVAGGGRDGPQEAVADDLRLEGRHCFIAVAGLVLDQAVGPSHCRHERSSKVVRVRHEPRSSVAHLHRLLVLERHPFDVRERREKEKLKKGFMRF